MRSRLRNASPTVASVADQVVSSGSNFVVSVVIGRFSGASALGGFAIALFVWIAIIGIQRAVLTEPLIIVETDPADTRKLRRVLGAALGLALLLSAAVGLAGVSLVAAGMDRVGAPLAIFGLVLPAVLGQDFWRALSFGIHRPGRALANDVLFALVQIVVTVAFISADLTSAPWFVLAWGAGGAAGFGYGFVQFGARPTFALDAAVLRELWPVSRWLLWDFLTSFGARESYLIVVATFVTAAEFGGLRAAESLLGPSVVILLAGGNVGLPGATRAFRHRGTPELAHYARRLTLGVGAAQWTFCALMAVVGPWLLVVLYGEQFEPYRYLVPILAVRGAISVIGFGPSIANKVAGLMRETFRARLAVAVVSVPTTAVVTARFGLAGAATASVVLTCALVVVLYAVYIPGVVRSRVQADIPERLGPTTLLPPAPRP
jgi:O-antigen/teichoic acid export membrane protein